MRDTPVRLEEVLELRAFSGCRVGDLFIQAWRDQPLATEQEQLTAAYDNMIEACPQGFSSMALIRIGHQIGSPDAGVRTRAIEQYKHVLPYLKSSAIVVDSNGIGARTLRVFISALLMVVRPDTPTRVFASFDEAFEWMQTLPGALDPVLHAAAPQLREDILRWWAKESVAP